MTVRVRGKVEDRWKGAAGGSAERGKLKRSRDKKQKHLCYMCAFCFRLAGEFKYFRKHDYSLQEKY